MNFSEEIDKRFELLHIDICPFHEAGEEFSILETNPEGHAEVSITGGSYPCFHVKMDKKVFPVLACQRCADYLAFVFDPQTEKWTLHIFEMTKSISAAVWEEKILPQFNGGLTNAYAIMGILRCCMDFEEVQVHCCYQRNRSETSPAYLKAPLGKPAPRDWLKEPVTFTSFPRISAKNVPVKLDKEGNGQFNL